ESSSFNSLHTPLHFYTDRWVSRLLMLTTYRSWLKLLLLINRSHMEQQKNEVLPGTLTLMVLKTISTLGSLLGYGIARRIEQIIGVTPPEFFGAAVGAGTDLWAPIMMTAQINPGSSIEKHLRNPMYPVLARRKPSAYEPKKVPSQAPLAVQAIENDRYSSLANPLGEIFQKSS